ncbi:M15 family metallopeptidase [Actinomadura litoris]|uniref:Dipeptidase n=1 Tax=Actinomadura litoris TaxID=2678616 RepID=A0A7K1LBP4_9ACTN|nr:M15 family metallopeptidase [Actinomadura litoris]MUN41686.1 dipeptidase [Actinomadura litoris]
MCEIVLMSDPRVTAVSISECGETLSDLRRHEGLLVDPRKRSESDTYFYLRQGLADRLEEAEALLPSGMRFLIVEGYRSLALQRRYFDEYASRLRTENPDWDEQLVRSATSRFVSPPEVAPHCMGAAVDLTLADDDGNEFDLGTMMNATPEESTGACYTHAPNISNQARELRSILGKALNAVELVNYPTE